MSSRGCVTSNHVILQSSSESSSSSSPFTALGLQFRPHGPIESAESEDPPRIAPDSTALLEFISTTLGCNFRSRDLSTLLHNGAIARRLIQILAKEFTSQQRQPEYDLLSRTENIQEFLRIYSKLRLTKSGSKFPEVDVNDCTHEKVLQILTELKDAPEFALQHNTLDPTCKESKVDASDHRRQPPLSELFTSSKNHLPKSSSTPQFSRFHNLSEMSSVGLAAFRQKQADIPSFHQISSPHLDSSSRSRSASKPQAKLIRSKSTLASPAQSPLVPRTELRRNDSSSQQNLLPRESITMKSGITFILGDILGRGQFGTVHRGIDTASGRIVAIKRIPVLGKSSTEVDTMLHEVALLKSLKSQYIVTYEGFCIDERFVSIVLEYCENGSLLQTVRTFGCFNEKLTAGYTLKILQGLAYLHSQDVVHCDVKCANVLTTKSGEVKLTDFGISLTLSGQTTIKGASVQGTPNWLAPEVIALRGTSKSSDIWALGCTVLEMVTGRPPYNGQNAMSTMYSIVEDKQPPMPSNLSDELRGFLSLCFQKDPHSRPSAKLLLKHAWIGLYFDLYTNERTVAGRGQADPRPGQETTDVVEASKVRNRISFTGFPKLGRSQSQKSTSAQHSVAEPQQMFMEQDLDRAASDRPSTAPCSSLASAVLSLKHKAVVTQFRHHVACSVCGIGMRKAMFCQRCRRIAHAHCLASSTAACVVTDAQARVDTASVLHTSLEQTQKQTAVAAKHQEHRGLRSVLHNTRDHALYLRHRMQHPSVGARPGNPISSRTGPNECVMM